jgi:SAM-dependent methyltransferase
MENSGHDAKHPTPADLHLAFLAHLGVELPHGARILDLGCGAGDSVAALSAHGYECYGIDPALHWLPVWGGKADRGAMMAAEGARLPFADHFFDFCFSDQVLEHVAEYRSVFSELGRVLKPRAMSLHRFPGPNCLIEAHVGVPLPWLCYWSPYLAVWAIAGRRVPEQRGFSWRQVLADNRRRMRATFYPTKRALRRLASESGVAIAFLERAELPICAAGRLAALQRRCAAMGIGAPGRLMLPLIAQRYMLLRPRGKDAR